MTSLARSASLADLSATRRGPSAKIHTSESHRTSTGSPQKAAKTNWKWLHSSTSFHEKEVKHAPSDRDTANNKRKTAPQHYLEHLETLLPQYCQHLSNPTYQEASNAMSLLLNSTPPRLTPSFVDLSPASPDKPSRLSSRPKENDAKTSVTSEMNRLLSSPFRVRKPRRNKQQEHENAEKVTRRWSTVSSSRSLISSQASNVSTDVSHHSFKPKAFFKNKTEKAETAAWREFVAPLVLLAGAESIYSDLEHVHPHPTTIQWPGLYQRVARELQARLPPEEHTIPRQPSETSLKQPESTLVTPPHSPPKIPSATSNDLFQVGILSPLTPIKTNLAPDKTKTKCKRLRSLCTWLDVKTKWLPFRESLYTTWSSDNLMFLREFSAALPSKETFMDCSSTRLMEALKQEIEATLALMEMGFSLERGRFLETICMARKVKQHFMIFSSKETALILWMKTTFQDYLAIMNILFDKIFTFAEPLFGFDLQILTEVTQGERTKLSDEVVDLDKEMIEFLKRNEKAGGTAMMVAIVLDDEQRPNARHDRVELGFALQDTGQQQTQSGFSGAPLGNQRQQQQQQRAGNKSNASPERDEKTTGFVGPKLWPAVYLRTSMRLAPHQSRSSAASSANTSLGLISGMRRNTHSRGSGLEVASASHGSGLLRTTSTDGSPRSKYRKGASGNRNLVANGNIFEYVTEPSSHASWPHSEWLHLRSFLEAMTEKTGTAHIVTDRLPPNSPTSSPRRSGDAHLAPSSPFEEPLAVTLQPEGAEPEEARNIGSPPASVLVPGHLWDQNTTQNSLSLRSATSESGGTAFHAVRLSEYMWMSVMVKGEEQSRWHRKSRGLPDTEVRAFLNDMAAKLRISNRFLAQKTCQTARVKVKDPLAPRVRGRDLGLRDAQWQSASPEDDDNLQEEVVEAMKEAFSVSASTQLMNRAESILTTMSGGFRPSTVSRSPRDRRRVLALSNRNSDYREGAAMLFLGPELYRQFLESTNE